MIYGHTTFFFAENSHERPFSIIRKANTYGILTKKHLSGELYEPLVDDQWPHNTHKLKLILMCLCPLK
jgi:hypothetical protein